MMKARGLSVRPRSVASRAIRQKLVSSPSRFSAADSRKLRVAISSYSTMSRRRHQPPGQGDGKLDWRLYSTSPLTPPRSSPGSIRIGVAMSALATSVRRPVTFFHQAVLRVPPGQ
jgi:hypothetical protein